MDSRRLRVLPFLLLVPCFALSSSKNIPVQVGEVKWRVPTNAIGWCSPAVGPDGAVYIGDNDGYLYAISKKLQRPKWKFKTNDWIISSPVIADDMIYVGGYDQNLYIIEKDEGLKKGQFSTQGAISSSAIVHNEKIYFTSQDGSLYAAE